MMRLMAVAAVGAAGAALYWWKHEHDHSFKEQAKDKLEEVQDFGE